MERQVPLYNVGGKVNWYSNYGEEYVCVRAKLLQLCLTLRDHWTAPCQAPLSMGLSGQEYFSWLLFPCPGGSF